MLTPEPGSGEGTGNNRSRSYDGEVTSTWRATQKANRRAELLHRAAGLFAVHGFAGVSTGDLGEAVGMSGPALYNYFPSKEALLAEILVDVSTRLLEGGREIREEGGDARVVLRRLLEFHVDFALADAAVIRVQDRELASLPTEASHEVRALQRQYVALWSEVLVELVPTAGAAERDTRLLAVFGLINSTPHSVRGRVRRALLADMAEAALLV